MKVIVHMFVKKVELDVEEGTTIGELKAIIHEHHEVPVDQQFFVHKGRRISGDDSKTLSELGVGEGDHGHIHFIIPPRGG